MRRREKGNVCKTVLDMAVPEIRKGSRQAGKDCI